MLFASINFILFLFIVFTLFFLVPSKYRKLILAISSIVFLSSYSVAFLGYAIVFILVNYLVGNGISLYNGTLKKGIYYFGQIFNISGLLIFKYINFIIENGNFLVRLFADYQFNYVNVIVPIGISYYTFQGISYLYLIHKAKDNPEKNFIDFLLYMLFWPKLLAGPIERHRKFLPQAKQELCFDYDRIVSGSRLFMWGLFKKVVVGDTFAIILSKVYGNMEAFQGVPLILTFMIQPLQIYCDFSGYTDMALGLAKIFGFKLTDNFNRPLMAKSIGEFWRRWHISLSSWCSDFIYNRILLKYRKWGDKAFVYAIFCSFTIIGIWHGSKWTYVFLGFMQIVALIYEFMTRRWRKSLKKQMSNFVYVWGSRAIVYFFFSASLVFFFAMDLGDVAHFYKYILDIKDITNTSFGFNIIHAEFYIAVLVSLFILLRDLGIEEQFKINKWFYQLKNRSIMRWGLYLVWTLFVVYFSKNQEHFVYMQF